jgi:hypothetical protein
MELIFGTGELLTSMVLSFLRVDIERRFSLSNESLLLI